nr:hypothetical protein [uncultured Fluviicola sp.]
MKPKKINYKIEEPCHADWDQMKPEAKGRFCESCSKTVVDFSSMSDFSIVNYLENNKHESVCGRFEEKQLDKTYLLPKSYNPAFGFDLKAVALGLALSTFSALPSRAQNVTQIEQYEPVTDQPVIVVKQGEVAAFYDHTDESFAAGKIAMTGKDYERVTISLLDGSSVELSSVKASKNGTFKIPLDWAKKPVAIRVSAPGFTTKLVYFRNHESLGNLSISLNACIMVKGKVAYDRED